MYLKELEDYSWFPKILRKYQMDFIGFVVDKSSLYKTLFTQINIKQDEIFDLCSGSGLPAKKLGSFCNKKVLLSDKYPQDPAFIRELNILDYKFDEKYFYTVFNAFHHFNLDEQKQIISALAAAKADFIIVEIVQPTIISFIKILLTTTIGQILITPFIKPFSITRIILTYLIPINLFTITYDGLISVLKSKTIHSYKRNLSEFLEEPHHIYISKHSYLLINDIIVISNKKYNK